MLIKLDTIKNNSPIGSFLASKKKKNYKIII